MCSVKCKVLTSRLNLSTTQEIEFLPLFWSSSGSTTLIHLKKKQKKNSGTLTSHHANEEVKLFHGVAEGGADEPDTSQTPTNHDDGTTAKFVDQDAADWTWEQYEKPISY